MLFGTLKNHSFGIHKEGGLRQPQEGLRSSVLTGQQQQSMTSLVCSYRKEPTDTGAGRGRNRSPFVCEVRLVSHQHDDDITSPLCSHVVNPFCGLLEGVDVWKKAMRKRRSQTFLFQVDNYGKNMKVLPCIAQQTWSLYFKLIWTFNFFFST